MPAKADEDRSIFVAFVLIWDANVCILACKRAYTLSLSIHLWVHTHIHNTIDRRPTLLLIKFARTMKIRPVADPHTAVF